MGRILDVVEYEGPPPQGPISMRVGRSQPSHNGPPTSPGGGLHLSGVRSEFLDQFGGHHHAPDGAKYRYDNCFKIITAKRTFLLCAPVSHFWFCWIT